MNYNRNPEGKGGFKKGESGNPSGRSIKSLEVKALAEDYSLESVECLVALMRNKKEDSRTRLAAAKEILDRAVGKAAQAVELAGKDGADLATVINLTLKSK